MCTVKICHLSITLGGASLLTDRKTRSPTAHSTCLGTQWQDASHASDKTDSKNKKKPVTRTHYLFLTPFPQANFSPGYVIFISLGNTFQETNGNKTWYFLRLKQRITRLNFASDWKLVWAYGYKVIFGVPFTLYSCLINQVLEKTTD